MMLHLARTRGRPDGQKYMYFAVFERKEITDYLLKKTDIADVWGIGRKLSKRLLEERQKPVVVVPNEEIS